jgi:hypothetical protein
VATVDAKTGAVTIVGAGMATITASQATDRNYKESQLDCIVRVAKKICTLTGLQDQYKTVGDNPYTLLALSLSSADITYTSSNSSVATVEEHTGIVTIVGAGTTFITATQAYSHNYHSIPASYILIVQAAPILPETSYDVVHKVPQMILITNQQVILKSSKDPMILPSLGNGSMLVPAKPIPVFSTAGSVPEPISNQNKPTGESLPSNIEKNFLETNPLIPVTINVGDLFEYQVPQNVFPHVDDDVEIQYDARVQTGSPDGAPLPSWLSFDTKTRQFSGTPPPHVPTHLDIRISGIDRSGHKVFTVLNINITK